MKPYIMLNSRLRTNMKNEFKKDLFRLMDSKVIGNTMENIRNHKDIKLVTNIEKYGKYVMRSNFKDRYPFSKELFVVKIGKTKIRRKKLIPWASNVRPKQDANV